MKIKIIILSVFITGWVTAQSLDDLEWLTGQWVYFTLEDSSYEVWSRGNDGNYNGYGLTIINGDTVFYENLRIIQKEGNIYYEALIEDQNEGLPVHFKLVRSKSGFSFINREHDFPQKIVYNLLSDTLKIRLEGIEEYYEKVIDLIFVKDRSLK